VPRQVKSNHRVFPAQPDIDFTNWSDDRLTTTARQGADFTENRDRVTAELVRSRLPELASRATTTWSRDIRTGVRASRTG
jgi:hypothetical protein